MLPAGCSKLSAATQRIEDRRKDCPAPLYLNTSYERAVGVPRHAGSAILGILRAFPPERPRRGGSAHVFGFLPTAAATVRCHSRPCFFVPEPDALRGARLAHRWDLGRPGISGTDRGAGHGQDDAPVSSARGTARYGARRVPVPDPVRFA